MQCYKQLFIIVASLAAILIAWCPLPAAANTIIPIGITGVFVSAPHHTLQAEIRVLYAGGDAYARASNNTSLISTTDVIVISSSTLIINDRGQAVSLDRIPEGTFFNASVDADTTAHIITARTIYFGTRLSAPRTFPDVSPAPLVPSISFSPTPMPAISLMPTPIAKSFEEIPFDADIVGTIATVDIPTRTIVVTLHSMYDMRKNMHRLDGTTPTVIVLFTLPDAVAMARLGVPIAIVSIKPRDTFNARAAINLSTHTATISSINLTSPGPSFNVMTGSIASITATNIALKNALAPEQNFIITPQTVFLVGTDRGSSDNVIAGRPASVAFVMNGNAMEAVTVELGTFDMKTSIEKFFALKAISMRATRVSGQLRAMLQRFSHIIAKQQAIISNLSTHGVSIANAEKLLSLSHAELGAARTALEKTTGAFDAITRSADQKAGTSAAHTLLISAISAEKKVFAAIKATQKELVSLSEK